MKRRVSQKVLMAGLVLAPLAALPTNIATAQSVVSPSSEIVLSIGRGELINVPGNMADVFIANEGIADVQVKSRSQLYLFGKSGGETTVYASDSRGAVIWSANVRVGSNIGSIDQLLALAMPEAKVNVATMGTNTVLLTGTVAAPEDAAEAQALVEAFVGEETNVISRLKMATPLQVNLQVKIAEVSRSVVRSIGVNLTSIDSTSGFKFGIGQGNAAGKFSPGGTLSVGSDPENVVGTSITKAEQGTTFGFAGSLLGLDLASALNLAETQGLVTTLAEPNLTALSGETAAFLAGGEFPIPLSQGLGTTTIQFKQYGVSLAYQVPGLTTRRAETTVELGSGQSFMIAGLLSNNSQNQIEKAPGLGDVPILGSLFRSTEYRKGETELVIMVTPYLVKPVNASDIRLPTDGYLAPTEGQRLIGMQGADGVSNARRPGPVVAGSNPADPATPAETNNAPDAAVRPGFSFD
ncbi:MAG: secretion system protein [Citromicrobium sp.]|nr:MAG: secretion system protein [Citromicrobium sp.]